MYLILASLLLALSTPAWADPTPRQVEIQGRRYEAVRLNVVEVPMPLVGNPGQPGQFFAYGMLADGTGRWIRLYATYDDETKRLCEVNQPFMEGSCEEQR